jgi:hypothetical protein
MRPLRRQSVTSVLRAFWSRGVWAPGEQFEDDHGAQTANRALRKQHGFVAPFVEPVDAEVGVGDRLQWKTFWRVIVPPNLRTWAVQPLIGRDDVQGSFDRFAIRASSQSSSRPVQLSLVQNNMLVANSGHELSPNESVHKALNMYIDPGQLVAALAPSP